MDALSVVFSDDIVISEEAFTAAANDFESLSQRLQALNDEIEDLLTTLQTGFDTPAGRKFYNACEKNLRQPMADQRAVLDHISSTLANVRTMYSTVFTQYNDLNNKINGYQHNS